MLIGKIVNTGVSLPNVEKIEVVDEIPEVEKGKKRQSLRSWLRKNFDKAGEGTFVPIDMTKAETVAAKAQTKLVFSKDQPAKKKNATMDLPLVDQKKDEEPEEPKEK